MGTAPSAGKISLGVEPSAVAASAVAAPAVAASAVAASAVAASAVAASAVAAPAVAAPAVAAPALSKQELANELIETARNAKATTVSVLSAGSTPMHIPIPTIRGASADLFFRSPKKTFDMIYTGEYVVHMIYTHANVPPAGQGYQNTFQIDSQFPIAVFQPGVGALGCKLLLRADDDYKALFTNEKNLKFLFSQVFYGGVGSRERERPIISDLHYGTSDVLHISGENKYDTIPERVCFYSEKEKNEAIAGTGPLYGIYQYNPQTPLAGLVRQAEFDVLFDAYIMRARTLVDIIPYVSGTYSVPNIFMFVSCVEFSGKAAASGFKEVVAAHKTPSRYSFAFNTEKPLVTDVLPRPPTLSGAFSRKPPGSLYRRTLYRSAFPTKGSHHRLLARLGLLPQSITVKNRAAIMQSYEPRIVKNAAYERFLRKSRRGKPRIQYLYKSLANAPKTKTKPNPKTGTRKAPRR